MRVKRTENVLKGDESGPRWVNDIKRKIREAEEKMFGTSKESARISGITNRMWVQYENEQTISILIF